MEERKKRFIAISLTLLMCLSISVPVLANTTDERVKLEWTQNECYDATRYRIKDSNSGTYFKVVNNTLPGSGFYIRAVSEEDSTGSAKWFYINDYKPYVINHSYQNAGYAVRLETWYPKEWGYNWGNVTIDWSPDYSGTGATLLN